MEQTSLNIGTIGQKLESARQAKGVSVSEAGQATKILAKFIEAMEADDFGVLSAPVYAKSFIRMYAQYLGLDAQPLVEEYSAQHAPKGRPMLSDDVRQKLAAADRVSADVSPSSSGEGKAVLSGVNQTISRLSGSGLSPKAWMVTVGGLLVVLVVLLSLTQCDSDDEEIPEPVAGGAARVERQLLYGSPPDAYLVKPGEIEVDR
jgi:hypothetical protein